jgi:beta-phosphoglucomutase
VVSVFGSNHKAVLFDFDGVLGRTLEDNYDAWVEVFARFGAVVDREEYLSWEGRRSTEIIPHLLKRSGVDPGLASEIIEQKNEYYEKNNTFSFYPGVMELLTWLRTTQLKLAVVSGWSAERLLKPPSNAILHYFDAVITAVDYQQSKPCPEPYLFAAQRLAVTPEECVVIENAPLGIQAAKAAGMVCIALRSTLSDRHLGAADLILDDISELHKWFAAVYPGVVSGHDD